MTDTVLDHTTAPLSIATPTVEVFTSLVDALTMSGYECVVNVCEQGQPPQRIGQPSEDADTGAPSDADGESASWAHASMLARSEPLRRAGTSAVSLPFQADTDDSEPWLTGELLARRSGGALITHDDVRVLRDYIDHAVAVATVGRLRALLSARQAKIDNLELALQSNREIGVAVGIIVATSRCSADQAFEVLRRVSQHSNRKIRDIAAEIGYTGEIPAAPPPRPSDTRPRGQLSRAR